jgi:cytoskeletal protein CcmA (bactofilin family)
MLRRFGGELNKTRPEPEAPRPEERAEPVAARELKEMADREREYTREHAAATLPQPTGELNALLGKGSEFDGKLAFEGTVRIDGTFSGEITTSDTLIVGEGARVQAEISCGTIVVHGQVGGNIHAKQAVELHTPAQVKGDITTPSLMIQKGVVFEGHSKMEDLEPRKIVPLAAAEAD